MLVDARAYLQFNIGHPSAEDAIMQSMAVLTLQHGPIIQPDFSTNESSLERSLRHQRPSSRALQLRTPFRGPCGLIGYIGLTTRDRVNRLGDRGLEKNRFSV